MSTVVDLPRIIVDIWGGEGWDICLYRSLDVANRGTMRMCLKEVLKGNIVVLRPQECDPSVSPSQTPRGA